MNLFDIVGEAKTVAITCCQFGDTGKGKFVDLFAQWADIIARGTGGDNAGHTIHLKDEDYVFHIVPSGILCDQDGKINIIGNGTAVYPKTLLQELELLEAKGLSYDNLRLAYNAKLILPQHIVMDRLKEYRSGQAKIGTTGKGIGPVYADHTARLGLTISDMLNKDLFVKKLKRNLADKKHFFSGRNREALEVILSHEHLLRGQYYHHKDLFDVDSVIEQYLEYGNRLLPLICDTDALVQKACGKRRILLEGAQGLLLSVDYGTYPFVTSSDSSSRGLVKGVGLAETDIDLSFGIIKGFYMTRVGCGPFPTEIGGRISEEWCNSGLSDYEYENQLFSPRDINHEDEYYQGIALRLIGNEYGATTKRPRRTGWLDLPLLRYAVSCGMNDIIMTKLDVLDDVEVIKVCHSYVYSGPDYYLGDKKLSKGTVLEVAIPMAEVLQYCDPVYSLFPGWNCSLEGITEYQNLPDSLKLIAEYIAEKTGVNIRIISIGADREQTIFVK